MKEQKNSKSILKDWYSNKYQIVLLQKNLFSLFTIFALISVVVAVFFVKNITESKSFEPFIIEMEDKTGRIQVVENVTSSKLTTDKSLNRYFIYSFLKAYEGYDYNTYKDDMKFLGLYTTPNLYRQIINRVASKNMDSPSNRLGVNGVMTIKIKSILFLTANSASIRFKVENTKPSPLYPAEKHLVGYLEFGFFNLDLTESERFINPLGFQITKYRVDIDNNLVN